jgi:outer membrane lipoprotein LolB
MYARAVLRRQGEVYNVGLRWQRQADGRFMMMLDAPFGQGVLRIDALKPDVYRLRLPDGQSFENSSAEALLKDAVGWSLPVSGLEYWVRGLPHARTEHSYRLDAGGRAQSISQDGWDIEYFEYSPAAAGPALPRRLRLGNDELSFQLVIERWRPAAAAATDSELFPSFD